MRRRYPLLWMSAVTLLGVTQSVTANPVVAPKRYIPALATAETILVDVYTLDGGEGGNNATLFDLVAGRMKELGFKIATEFSQPHDVAIQVICRNPHLSIGRGSADGQSRGKVAARMVNGPACTVEYLFEGERMQWQRVDRVVYTLGVKAVQAVLDEEPGPDPDTVIARYLKRYDYPLLLVAEWRQVDRLRALLEDPSTDTARKRMIISLLGEIRAHEAMACLLEALEDESLVRAAALALGNFGHSVRAPLISLLRTTARPEVQAAAARSLGLIGAETGDWSLTPLFLEILNRPNLDIAVRTELVWALGKNPDRRSLPVLDELYKQAWTIRSDDPRLQQLRAAIDWSHRAVRLGGHTDEY